MLNDLHGMLPSLSMLKQTHNISNDLNEANGKPGICCYSAIENKYKQTQENNLHSISSSYDKILGAVEDAEGAFNSHFQRNL